MNFLAKSDKTDLYQHSNLVKFASLNILKSNSSEETYKRYENILSMSAMLHDIGKCTVGFQEYLNDGTSSSFLYYHNQVGAAFLSKHLTNLSEVDKKNVLNVVYWHHGILRNASFDDIYDSLSQKDIDNMSLYLTETMGSKYLTEDPIYDENLTFPPDYFKSGEQSSKNVEIILLRSLIIGGDKLVSKIDKSDLNESRILEDIKQSLSKTHTCDLKDNLYTGTNRFNLQCDIVSQCSNTSIINAPDGFGKTLLGLLWGIRSNKKIIWVCPRNFIAESVYESILKELNALNLGHLSVELFLTNEIKKHNRNEEVTESFTSDIIVTNIDNFLFTSINNNKLNYLYLTNDVDVVFDEYHELVTDSGIMSLFVNIMKIRHHMLSSNTLLLSATYLPLNELWDTPEKETKVLPNKYEHYKASHNKKYNINITHGPSISYNSLSVFNAISIAQEYKLKTHSKYLIHSKFEQDDRKQQVSDLLSLYGRKTKRNVQKDFVIGTHILQASLDVSFKTLNDSVLSPESTMQRIGRCDRWGDYTGGGQINIFKPDIQAEKYVISNLYDDNLSKLWFECLQKYDGTRLNLNDLYKIYNSFSYSNRKDINRFVRKRYNESKNALSTIYPIKYPNSDKEIEYYTTRANKLRCSDKDMFVIYEKPDGTYTEIFTECAYSNIARDFGENDSTIPFMKKVMCKMDDSRYDYSFIKNKKTKKQRDKISADDLIRQSKRSNSPYIRFDCVYVKELGVVKRKLIERYNK